jgi:hypothetical protein
MHPVLEKFEFWAGVGLAVVIVLGYLGKKSLAAAQSVGEAVNPVSPNNIFYRGANAVGGAVSGDSSFSLGGWIYSATHPDPTALPDNPQAKRPAATTAITMTGMAGTPLAGVTGAGSGPAPYSTTGTTVDPTADPYASPLDPTTGGQPLY